MISYLDNSATTRPTQRVADKMLECMLEGYFNPSSQYAPAVAAEKRLNACREAILAKLSTRDAEVIFTSGGTEANNLAILGRRERVPASVAAGATEHPSVLEPFRVLSESGRCVYKIPVTCDGSVDYSSMRIPADASLVSFMQVNNETGALLDVPRFAREVRAQAPNAIIHVDGVQGFLRAPIDFSLIDMYTLSGHKLHAPKGIGALVVKRGVRLEARALGGGQEMGLRGGTENTPGIAGLLEAIESFDLAPLAGKRRLLFERIKTLVPEAILNGPQMDSGAQHILNMSFPHVRGEVMLHALESVGVYVSTGSACSSKKLKVSRVLTEMGIPPERAEWAIRMSLSPLTTSDEIEYAAAKIAEVYPTLARFRRK